MVRPDPTRPNDGGDVEFESFHRSFAMGDNPLNSLVAASSNMPVLIGISEQESLIGSSVSPATSPEMTQQRHLQQQSSIMSPQEEQQQQGLSPVRQHRRHQYVPTPLHVNEDITVVQARQSMMARSGDRHARGKLPGPTEGRLMQPDSLAADPQLPPPRSSKRHLGQKIRPPDIMNGEEHTNIYAANDNEHFVTCPSCDRTLRVEKAAIVVRCKSCSKVSPGGRLHCAKC